MLVNFDLLFYEDKRSFSPVNVTSAQTITDTGVLSNFLTQRDFIEFLKGDTSKSIFSTFASCRDIFFVKLGVLTLQIGVLLIFRNLPKAFQTPYQVFFLLEITHKLLRLFFLTKLSKK